MRFGFMAIIGAGPQLMSVFPPPPSTAIVPFST